MSQSSNSVGAGSMSHGYYLQKFGIRIRHDQKYLAKIRPSKINDYSEGGLKMIDIASFNKSLKATWIKKYVDSGNRGKWKTSLIWRWEKTEEVIFSN